VHQLSSSQFQVVLPLAFGASHSRALIYAVLEGHSPGTVWVNDRQTPTAALVCTNCGYMFVLGNATNQCFNQAICSTIFNSVLPGSPGSEVILFSFSEKWRVILDELLKEREAQRIHRCLFDLDEEMFRKRSLQQEMLLPEGFTITSLQDRSTASTLNLTTWFDTDRFIRDGFGYCILHSDQVVSACYSVFLGGGEAEVDVFTADDYRRHGFAHRVATAFIEESLKRGIEPAWACWPHRQASQSLARKLGFRPRPDATAHYFSA